MKLGDFTSNPLNFTNTNSDSTNTHRDLSKKKHGWLNVLSYDLSKESGGFTLRIASVNGNVIYYACNIYICVKLDFVSPQNWGVNQKGHSCGSSES